MNKKIAVIFAAILSVAVTFAFPSARADESALVIGNWDGYMPPDLLENFSKEAGVKAELAVHATNEEIMGKLVAGGGRGYDVVFVSSPFAEALSKLGLIAEMDRGRMPNLRNLYPEAEKLPYDIGNSFSVPYAWGTTGLCYRSDLTGAPDGWDALLNPPDSLRGKVTMLSTERWLMASALLRLGYSVNESAPDKIEQAKELLVKAKRGLLAYDDATFYSKLVSGEAILTHAWDGWCNYGIAENADIKYVVPREGTDVWVDVIVIPKASENKEAAHRFINYVLGADVGKWVAENILYKVPNKAAMESLDASLIEQYPNLGMSPSDILRHEMLRDLGSVQKDYTRAVTEIMASQ